MQQFHLKLKVIWFKNYLGLAIDQVTLQHKHFLTPYYFWPKTAAQELLKLELDSNLWLTQKEKRKILKITGETMKCSLYSKNCNIETLENLKEKIHNVEIFIIENFTQLWL